ncbi:hypothetical protein DHW03_14045 [Pedobacter yonginense]|uniref:Uncharacterized protein n=2 Tax=Pedobacter yonginense TaxID=651869 RepID=A0A317EJW0_9SPHI|nr:hypothetical protein DHW03_14045 [Pedobacter yonginense]
MFTACGKKTDQDRAEALVESKYETSNQKIDFEQAHLDSLFSITPKAYADSLKKGEALDSVLALLESQIEQFTQKESDSVGEISAKLTQDRYRLLDFAKQKPRFIGWKLSGVRIVGVKSEILSFDFDEAITRIVE